MKNWVVIALTVVGGFAVVKYLKKTPFGQAFTPQQTGRQPNNVTSAAVTSVIPGIPSFAGEPAINRPDQRAAAMVTNPLASIDGSQGYAPAFGPTENQPDGNYLHTF